MSSGTEANPRHRVSFACSAGSAEDAKDKAAFEGLYRGQT